ncbi:ATP synthase F1 subunit delta [Ureaplasma miroungigenitalium]|uniref:ATP synthase subunit delta n=1 Tax=Ureaplasma miroungigenitalium TaxID=1042321 RepID=A0ABT3BN15_9BACT|nr:ATP synthase F1 subunit delta [Ureaplasma miroungigenitalium]MCV3728619.1 ATP synthase F1 subunit delta [Ureaplasma miroungigenitalium]MCV3734311.1 ATP synthase F1 subunit delta [Ureaplasma miroungigenitalium]
MKSIRSVQKYAYALLALAREENKLAEYKEQLEVIYEIIRNYPAFYGTLASSILDKKLRKITLHEVFRKEMNMNIIHFLELLIDREKINYLRSILKKTLKFIDNDLNIRKVIIHTAFELSHEQMNRLVGALTKKLDCTIEAEQRIDQHMIGGIRVNFEANEIDSSLRTKLDHIVFDKNI